ncbi:right-handed parallel beta-helix repeat-containing protein [Kitasatospora sp. DSM 101779]|uniref:right-handed parallel beta-helix repeat-containing protein n=1 Tax=Kitasatospora sp. DSM 101779 TaxID=2853165 RepID=UPI0021DA0A88|nr:right-handed parallel beta-helix repeat-containing protein [Kitasatospora sp. DSM 101779]MCU7820354.1 right-handed parallel beta-helix repeat-containing protein [Kitasatospora sp. DSM 101779]
MGADLSRVRFDALRDHSGVVMQQGRLLLDSDWNEFVAIVDRRLRAAAADLGTPGVADGSTGVAVVPRTTPDAFLITSSADGMTIGRGRMYVDGLLAENHGTGDTAFDPLLADTVRTQDTPYEEQPYWPAPEDVPDCGTHLVYLDVWQREVTPVQAPDLVEEAVGVDTTARTQTVWRVRVHEPDTPGIDCGTRDEDIPGWADVTAPSAGRLTTGTVAVAADDDPCSLPPGGDYRGLENQTYRVEVHDGGAPGTATFKWSRDNGSVAMRVVEVAAPDRLRPEHLGRDTVLGLRENDWVEILDDHRELDEQPGEMRRITTVHDDGTVSFTPALPGDLPATTDEALRRNLRIRRWDQAGRIRSGTGAVLGDLDAPGSTGVVTVPTGGVAVVLEHGITVTLDAPDGALRSGDHWIFTARTATATVEELDQAPPLGVHHHYARLAVVSFPSTADDCRTLWPTDGNCGDCTVCVTPDSHASGVLTVQAAVDRVAEDGGTVCLAPGVYHLGEEPVRIRQARSVRVRGHGPATLLIGDGGFDISLSAFVTLEDFALISSSHRPGIRIAVAAEVTVRRLTVLIAGGDGEGGGQGPAVQLSNACLRTRIQDCDITGRIGIEAREYLDNGDGVRAHLLTADLEISGNLLMCWWSGVQFAGSAAHVLRNTVRGNTVLFAQGAGLRLRGALSPWASFDIADNHVQTMGTGIEVGASGYTVRDNTITGNPDPETGSGHGIVVRSGESGVLRGTTRISGNHIGRIGRVGILVRVPTGDLDVSHNTVEGAGEGGIVVTERGRLADAVIVGNTLRDVATPEWSGTTGTHGIRIVGATHALVGSNTVRGLTTEPPGATDDEEGTEGDRRDRGEEGGDPDRRTGVALLACRESRIHGNLVEGIGPADPGEDDRCIGIHVSVYARTTVEGNVCRRIPADVDDDGHNPWSGLLVGDDPVDDDPDPDTPQIRTAHIGPYVSVLGDRVAYLVGQNTAFAHASQDVSATVSANTLTGAAEHPAARIDVAGDAVVSANQFRQHGDSDPPALVVRATTATVTGNRARGGFPSILLEVDPQFLAVLGNITSGGIDPENLIDPKWLKLNVRGVL